MPDHCKACGSPRLSDGIPRETVTAGVEIGVGAILLGLFAPMPWWVRMLVVLAGAAVLIRSRYSARKHSRVICPDCRQALADPLANPGPARSDHHPF
jgi:hypothetical protein